MNADRQGFDRGIDSQGIAAWEKLDVPEHITCVECAGEAHRFPGTPEDGFEAGDIVAFVCVDCGHRHDVMIDAE